MKKTLIIEAYCMEDKKCTKINFDEKCIGCEQFMFTTVENALMYIGENGVIENFDEDFIGYGGEMGEDDEVEKIKIWNEICSKKLIG